MASLPAHRRPPVRELGRRLEAAEHPFRGVRSDGGRVASPEAVGSDRFGAAPLVLVTQRGRAVVVATCPLASAVGLSIGMPAVQARALVADLDVRPHDAEADARLLHRLVLHAAAHWTPIAAACGDGVDLDLTGASHLFGGEERFCRHVVGFMRRLGLTARIAVSDTLGASHALARHSGSAVTVVPVGGTVQAVAPLPTRSLRLDDRAVDAARRFGLDRVGDLLAIPRAPLARRLGRAAIERLDQALGRVAEPLDPVVPDEPVVAERRLLEPICTAEAIGRVASDLVDDLVGMLRARGLGVRAVRLTCLRVDGDERHLAFGTARATREAGHLLRLLEMRIERIDPGFGIEIMRLHAVATEPLAATALGAVLAGEDKPRDVADAVDRLAGRVGSAALFRSSAVESDVPERAVVRVGPLTEPVGWPGHHRPVRLLARPEPLHGVLALLPDAPPRRFEWRGRQHRVVAGDGPERIHGEWWRSAGEVWAVRDYFRVEDEAGGRYWLFRRGDGVDPGTGDLSWHMHGLFG